MFGQLRQIAIMRKALLYYANRDTYRRVGVHPKGSPVKYDPAPIVNDHGSRARAALHAVEGMGAFRLFRRKPVALGTFKATVPQDQLPQQSATLGLE
jgi:hypothetical protein